MKVLFFSDIHGNRYVLDSLLKAIENEKVDKVVFCGDIFGYYYYQEEIINLFRNERYHMLLGNHDFYFLSIVDNLSNEDEFVEKYGNSYHNIIEKISKDNIQFLKLLKPQHEFIDNGIKIGVFHGTPEDPINGRLYPDSPIINSVEYEKYDFVVLGHTHHKMVRSINKTLILNPGSIGQQRDGKGCSYLVLNTLNKSYHFGKVEYNINLLIEDINRLDKENYRLKEVLLRNGVS